jgi:hypothetical protein
VVLAAVAYGAALYGWPWARERLRAGSPSAMADDETGDAAAFACVAQAERALADFRDKVESRNTSQVELNWFEAMRRTRAEVEAAERACRCDADACVEAADAMAELTGAAQEFETTMRRGGTPHGVSSRIARIEALLGVARGHLRRDP